MLSRCAEFGERVTRNLTPSQSKLLGLPGEIYYSVQCIDLTFIYSLLNKYGLKDSTEIGIFKQINGHETSWALGAALDFLDKQN